MNIKCPKCSKEWDWSAPDDVTGARKGPSEKPTRSYSINCPNPDCNYPIDIEA